MESIESKPKTPKNPRASRSGAGRGEDSAKYDRDSERFLLCRLGETIQKKRLEIGLSQEQLCALTNMNRTYLSDVERGVSNASFLVLWKVSRALQIDLWQIIKDIRLDP